MNIKLFTSDNVRENVLKHVRGGSGLCYRPHYQITGDERSCMVTPSAEGTAGSLSSDNSFDLSPLPALQHTRSLSPQYFNYSQLTNAQEVIDNC